MTAASPRRRWQAGRAEGSKELAMTILQNGRPNSASVPTLIPYAHVEDNAADEATTAGECTGNALGTNGGER